LITLGLSPWKIQARQGYLTSLKEVHMEDLPNSKVNELDIYFK